VVNGEPYIVPIPSFDEQFMADWDVFRNWPRLPGGQLDPASPPDPRKGPEYMRAILGDRSGAQEMIDKGLSATAIVANLERQAGGTRQTPAQRREQERRMAEETRLRVLAQQGGLAATQTPGADYTRQLSLAEQERNQKLVVENMRREALGLPPIDLGDVFRVPDFQDPSGGLSIDVFGGTGLNGDASQTVDRGDISSANPTGNPIIDKALDDYLVGLQMLDELGGGDEALQIGGAQATGTDFTQGYYQDGEFISTAREPTVADRLRIQGILDDFNVTMQAWTADEKDNFVIAMNQVRVTGQVPSQFIETHQPPHPLAGEFTATSKLLLDIADKHFKRNQAAIDAHVRQADSKELLNLQNTGARNLARLQANLDETKAAADEVRAEATATKDQVRKKALLDKANELDIKLLNEGNEFTEAQNLLARVQEMQMAENRNEFTEAQNLLARVQEMQMASFGFHQEKALMGVGQEGAEALLGMQTQAGEDLAELEAQLGETRAEANAVRAEAAATSNQTRQIALLEKANSLDVAVRSLENKFTAEQSRLGRVQERELTDLGLAQQRQLAGLGFTQELFQNPSALAAFQFNQLGQVPQGAQQVGFDPSQRPGAGFVGPSLLQGGGLFPGGAPTIGGLNQLVPEQLQQLQGLLSLFGIAPGFLGQRARQVTPGVQFRPDLIGGGRMLTER
jgi:hypothetical protein